VSRSSRSGTGRGEVDARGARGVQVGAGNVQVNVFADSGFARGPVCAVPPLWGDEVARPGLMAQLVEAVTRSGASAVGMTTGLWGAGGFGKTTLARLLVHRPEVKQRFPDGVMWVTLGEDIAGPGLAEKITNVAGVLCGVRPPLTDPLAAGAELGRALGERRVLLVIDDVWTSAQVEPFLVGGSAAVRVFTTRIRGILPPSVEAVQVDEMEQNEAAQLLTAGVSRVPVGVAQELMRVTGRWAVLLALVNGAVRTDLSAGREAEESMREILQQLRTTGPTVLDITDADERHTAVARTIEVGLSRLTAEQRARYLELAVFEEDVAIPGPVLARYWKITGGWSEFQTQRYCRRLAGLTLVSDYRRDPDQIALHDVIRAYLREQTQHRRSELHRAFLDAHRDLISDAAGMSAWWQLQANEMYLWGRVPTHLHSAGLDQELRTCVHHPRWLVGKLEGSGPAGLEADLALSDDPLSRALATTVRQNAHILGPLAPAGSLAATLATRLPGDGPTRTIAEQLVAGLNKPHLRAITALPDLPHPALSRVLTGHTGPVTVLAVAPDGSWLASAGDGGEVWIWDPISGNPHHTLTGHIGGVEALAVAPDGSWLASAGDGGEVRIWDPISGNPHHTLTGHIGGVEALAVAPDGSWLASAGYREVRIWDPVSDGASDTVTGHTHWLGSLAVAPDGSWLASAGGYGEVRIWDPISGNPRHTLTGHTGWMEALAVAPDGSWLASASGHGEVRIWDPVTGTAYHTLTGHTREVRALAVAPDGSWLASAGGDGEVRIWDPISGNRRHILTGHTGEVRALAVAPDGSWLASAGGDGEVRIWDPISGNRRHILTGHTGEVRALAVAPDGSWLASTGEDGEVRIWDPISGNPRHTLTGHTGEVRALAVAPDGSWLASAGGGNMDRVTGNPFAGGYEEERICNGEVWIWDPISGNRRHTLTGHAGWVEALAVAPDGSWLASASGHGEVRIWDPVTGTAYHTLTGHTRRVKALAVAPDGSWLASASGDFYSAGEVRIWDPTVGTPLTSLRVVGELSALLWASTTITVAGHHGPYFLALCNEARSV
jgi:WD40 repeat protein